MTSGADTNIGAGSTALVRGPLRPVAHRGRWIASGAGVQLIGLGGLLAYVATRAKHQDAGGLITTATVRLAWDESLHAEVGIAVLAAGAILVALGSVLLAHPFARRRLTLMVAVPLAALCAALALGVAVLIVAVAYLLFESDTDQILQWPVSAGKGRAQPSGEIPDTPQAPELRET